MKNPGQSCNAPIIFFVAALLLFVVSLASCSGAAGEDVVSRVGGGSQLSVSPSTINFGDVLLGESKTQTFTLTNSGSTNVVVSQTNVTGASFSLSGPSMPLTFTAGSSSTFSVTFTPSTTGNSSGSVSFVSDASGSSPTVSLAGNGVQSSHPVDLIWDPSPSTNVSGYNVYRGTQSGGPYSRINQNLVPGTTFTDGVVQSGQTYFYVVKAADGAGVESLPSNEAQAVIPSP